MRRNENGGVGLAVFAGVGALILIVVLSIGAWQLDWFVKEKNLERQVHLDNRNTGTQTAWYDQATSDVKDFYLVPETNMAARSALRDQACQLIGRLSSDYVDANLASFQAKECL